MNSHAPRPVPRAPCPASRVPITVALIIDDLGMGGAQRQLLELVQALPKDRYELHVISLSTTKRTYEEAIRRAGVASLTLIAQRGKWSWRSFWPLYRTLRSIRPAIVHTSLFTADLYGRLTAKLAGVPVILSTVHSVDLDKPRRQVVIDRLLKGLTDGFVVTAGAVGQMLQEREGVQDAHTTVIYNGVDLAQFLPTSPNGMLRRELGLSSDRPLIGIVGRLAPVKDHETFLKAVALVNQAIPESVFVVVGDGALKGPLQAQAQQLGVAEQVHFLGDRLQVSAIYQGLDLVVVSSRYEGCCRVILEAMAMGKPVVATAVGGNPELVIAHETGLLVPPSDPVRLAEAMVRILRDRHQASIMGQNGRRRAEQAFSLDWMVMQTDALYQRFLERANLGNGFR